VRLSLRMQILLTQSLDMKRLDEAFVYRHAVNRGIWERGASSSRCGRENVTWALASRP
jgi:hypothetical protein